MKTKEGIQKRVDKFDYFQNKRFESFYAFHRNITTISLGFIAIFIGLKPEYLIYPTQYLFLLTTFLFGLCILFSLITQHGEIIYYNKSAQTRAKFLSEYTQSRDGKTYQAELINIGKLYKFSEKLTYACLLLSILSLITYIYFLVIY